MLCNNILRLKLYSLHVIDTLIILFFLANLPPTLNGSDLFKITTKQIAVYQFTANDSDDFILQAFGELPGTLEKSGSEGIYRYTVNLTSAVNSTIAFSAVDTLNATSLLNPHIHMCACHNGECTMEGVLNRDANPLIMNCICPEGNVSFPHAFIYSAFKYVCNAAYTKISP